MKVSCKSLRTLIASAGLVAILTFTGTAIAAPGGGGHGHQRGQQGMRLEKMQAELGLSSDQVAKIKAIVQTNKEEMKSLRGQMKSVLTPEQQAQVKSWREKHKPGDKASRREAFKANKDALGLTDQQKQQLKTYREEIKTKRAAMRTQIEAVLTPEQKAKAEAKKAEWKAKRGERKDRREHRNKDASNG